MENENYDKLLLKSNDDFRIVINQEEVIVCQLNTTRPFCTMTFSVSNRELFTKYIKEFIDTDNDMTTNLTRWSSSRVVTLDNFKQSGVQRHLIIIMKPYFSGGSKPRSFMYVTILLDWVHKDNYSPVYEGYLMYNDIQRLYKILGGDDNDTEE